MDIKGGVALVSGGASGLGEATVRALCAAGAKVVIVDMNEARGAALVSELGESAAFVKADVSDEAQVQAAVDKALSLGPVRASVSCAGIGVGLRTLDKDGKPHNYGAFQKVIAVNLFGTFNM